MTKMVQIPTLSEQALSKELALPKKTPLLAIKKTTKKSTPIKVSFKKAAAFEKSQNKEEALDHSETEIKPKTVFPNFPTINQKSYTSIPI